MAALSRRTFSTFSSAAKPQSSKEPIMAKKTEVALSEDDAFELSAEMAQMAQEDAGAGSEGVGTDDLAVPYINILQALSPQLDDDNSAYIADAKRGYIFQNVNNVTWSGTDGIEVVPFAYERKVLEWIPREKGGGLVGVHPSNTGLLREATPNEKGVPTLENGNNLIDTSLQYVLYENPASGLWEPAVISMKSTAQKKSRLWNSLISQQMIPGTQNQAPRWLFVWKLTTVREEKDSNSWHNWEIARSRIVTADLYKRAKKLSEDHKNGLVRASQDSQDSIGEPPF
jgi:hypothetical protein